MIRPSFKACLLLVVCPVLLQAEERVNHAGRILGPTPLLTNPVLFNTPEADAIMASLQIFPPNHPWNEDISRRPLLPNSDAIIAQIYSELFEAGTNSPRLRAFKEMNFVLVPEDQRLVPIRFLDYADESDPSPYPIPSNLPIEGWPSETSDQTLTQVQQDSLREGGDRHSIIIQPSTGYVWETWHTLLKGSNWQAANGARFNLTNLAMRPDGWTSGDAAGLSMLGGLVRYDECERGEIEHAMRLIVRHTRREHIYPATHHASSPSTSNPNIPAMGQRLRLKASFVPPANWTKQEKALGVALRKYGGIIADNSSRFFSLSVVSDQRWPANAFSHITALSITNFEVIQTTGPDEGPRSSGSAKVDAGPDQTIARGASIPLNGLVQYSGEAPVTVGWKLYSGPGTVIFEDPTSGVTTATFNTTGRFTLLLTAEDGIHAPVYDAVVITVSDGIRMTIRQTGLDVRVGWTGGEPPFTLQGSESPWSGEWLRIGTFATSQSVTIPVDSTATFFRVLAE